jgi:hypothetical protein
MLRYVGAQAGIATLIEDTTLPSMAGRRHCLSQSRGRIMAASGRHGHRSSQARNAVAAWTPVVTGTASIPSDAALKKATPD